MRVYRRRQPLIEPAFRSRAGIKDIADWFATLPQLREGQYVPFNLKGDGLLTDNHALTTCKAPAAAGMCHKHRPAILCRVAIECLLVMLADLLAKTLSR